MSIMAEIQQHVQQSVSGEVPSEVIASFAAVLQQLQQAAAVPAAALQELMTSIESLCKSNMSMFRMEKN
jgi:transcriptional regulator NrdR family protein